ncbi:MAG: hypothetical protein H7319_21520 [Spirosoma sp.]|nr:hypothetical protein [Spirosoma sp.]
MRVETTPTEYVIRLDRTTFSSDDVERLLRTLRLKELSARLGGTQNEADQLAEEVMESWWTVHQSKD